MKKLPLIATLLLFCGQWTAVHGQAPLKPRPDAFPSVAETIGTKVVNMAATVEEMASWDRYPTYQTYLEMMQRWAETYPALCTLDTIGTSIQGRLILAARIGGQTASSPADCPEFFYSSTIHGDEVTGYVMMLRLIDTLLSSYGHDPYLTGLVDSTVICINPLANPDGTYHVGDHTVQLSVRENAAGVDLNRNYPDPFGGSSAKEAGISEGRAEGFSFAQAKAALQPENEAMIGYLSSHHFRLSANLHGGAEVMNYPWDCFTTAQNPHPHADWWQEVCRRFVDTCRHYDANHFNDVNSNGFIAGGDWYVIHGGRQDYVNYYHGCLELTMEISRQKTLSSDRLPQYWHFLAPSFINYIAEIHNLPQDAGFDPIPVSAFSVFPNPVTDMLTVEGLPEGTPVEFYGIRGNLLLKTTNSQFSIHDFPSGIYLLRAGNACAKVIKN